MSADTFGHITLRLELRKSAECESWEMPEVYYVLHVDDVVVQECEIQNKDWLLSEIEEGDWGYDLSDSITKALKTHLRPEEKEVTE